MLTKRYNVELLTGPERGSMHKYLHACVSLKHPELYAVPAATGAAPEAATVTDAEGTADPAAAAAFAPAATGAQTTTSVADLWDEF